MSKHTEGPLTVQTNGKGFYWVDKLTKVGGFSVCNTGTWKKAKANAILYSKAPEMYEAIKKYIEAEDGIVSGIADRKAHAIYCMRQAIKGVE